MFCPEELARRLREIRINMGLSQVDMAKKLGVSRGALCYYENGQRTPDIAFLCALHEFTGYSMEYLVGISEAKESINVDISKETGLNDEGLSLVKEAAPCLNTLATFVSYELSMLLLSLTWLSKGEAAFMEGEELGMFAFLNETYGDMSKILLDACKERGYASLSDDKRERIRAAISSYQAKESNPAALRQMMEIHRERGAEGGGFSIVSLPRDHAEKAVITEVQRLDDAYRRKHEGK